MPERTEAPTPHRIAEARRKGQIARSTEINTALLLLAGFWMLGPMAQRLASELAHMTRECFTWPLAQEELTVSGLLHGGLGVGLRFGLLLAPFVGVLMVTGIGANVLQTGLFFSFAGLKPNLSKLNPLSGLQRIVSKQGVIELAKASLKIAVVGRGLRRHPQGLSRARSCRTMACPFLGDMVHCLEPMCIGMMSWAGRHGLPWARRGGRACA